MMEKPYLCGGKRFATEAAANSHRARVHRATGNVIAVERCPEEDEFFTTPSGKVVNISELLRVNKAVVEQMTPGMSEQEVDQIISATVKRFAPLPDDLEKL